MTQAEQINAAYKEAWSLKQGQRGGTYIGSMKQGDKIFVFYQDPQGKYWYETKFQEAHGVVSEFKHAFGHTKRRKEKTTWKNYKEW